jgi:CRP/FNR family transcriptional regulator, cyclic AMP receptor protein
MLPVMATQSTYLEQLETVPLLSSFSKRELSKVARAADEIHVKEGRDVVVEGQVGHECFVILNGEATVSRDGRVIATLRNGDHFGELALLDGGPRTATVTATTDLDLLVLGQRQLLGLLEELPGLSRKMLATLASQVRRLDDHLYG